MKKLSQLSLMLLALMVAFTGCDAAKDAAQGAADDAKSKVADLVPDMGDFDLDGLKGKFTGITDGFKDVTADNVDGLTSKITDLSGSMDGMGLDKLPGPAKTFVGGIVSKFGDAVTAAMGGISDEGILGKLKPVVAGLMEKINAVK